MKIRYLQISNILSFPHVENIEDAMQIVFDEGVNIVIGQNGAGKSTVLEVINFIFKKVALSQYTFNQDVYSRRTAVAPHEIKNIVIKHNDQSSFVGFRLDPNWNTLNEDSKTRVCLALDSIDAQNIQTLATHFEQLRKVAEKYSNDVPVYQQNLPNVAEISIDVSFLRASNTYSFSINHGGNDFAAIYLTKYNLFRELILINNQENPNETVSPLLESFALIGGYRNYNAFNNFASLSGQSIEQQIQGIRAIEHSKSANGIEQNEPAVFSLVRLLVAGYHFKHFGDSQLGADAEALANSQEFLAKINEKLNLINLKIFVKLIDKRNWQYSFSLIDTKRDLPIPDINSLSAGQKAIIHLVFEAYGRGELKGGVIIIDEPEIHLHYQFQCEYMRIIDEINKEQNSQYILVTHSDSLINSETIGKVRRFALDENRNTVIRSPVITEDQKGLVKILDNTRSIYAFFAKKVVLVEGDSDRYLFKAIFQELFPALSQEIAVLDMGGKGGYQRWRSFFESFGLSVYYIGDFDNVMSLEFPVGGKIIKSEEKSAIESRIKQRKLDNLTEQQRRDFSLAFARLEADETKLSRPRRDLWKPVIDKFINFVSVSNVEIVRELRGQYPNIIEEIENKYSEGVFILKAGAIEEYIGGSHANLNHIADFCANDLISWCSSSNPLVTEVRGIVETIVSDVE